MLFGIIAQSVQPAVFGTVGGNFIGIEPAAVHVAEEIIARFNRVIDPFGRNSRVLCIIHDPILGALWRENLEDNTSSAYSLRGVIR